LSYEARSVEFDSSLVFEPALKDLPKGWDTTRSSYAAQVYGDTWAKSCQSVVLKVPSVINPQEQLYILNPEHPDFHLVQIDNTPVSLDSRL